MASPAVMRQVYRPHGKRRNHNGDTAPSAAVTILIGAWLLYRFFAARRPAAS
jgi:hypothetical protein